MIAYFEKASATRNYLVIAPRPCNGPEYVSATRLPIADKRAARAYCKAHGIKPWNF